MSTQVTSQLTEEVVREISGERDEPDWLLETRLSALDAIEELDFPEVIRTPGRTWTNLDALEFEELVDPLTQAERKEVDAPENVEALSFAEAIERDESRDLIREQFGSVVDPEENRLTALSTALFSTGTVVFVPEGVNAEDVTIRTTMNSRSLFNYTLVVTETNASVTILERQSTGEEVEGDRYYSGIVEVVGGENAFTQYGALQDLSQDTYNYTLKRGRADTYSTVNFIEGNLGSRLTKTTVGTELDGNGSETKIVGAFFGHDDQHFDLDSRVHHNEENTTADLVTRGVIDDTARSVYEGTQNVGADAWNTSSYQRENTLMLSDESEADASPKLIINNHDTEASHSATVGQIDQEDLLYMTTRGIPEGLATDMLVKGFFVPVLEEIEVEELREDLEGRIAERLRR
ncbi:MAG: Fe-S cluster assembly protein SufD [Halobacteriales archaeon]